MTRSRLRGGFERKAILAAVAAIAIVLVTLMARPSGAQGTDAPPWWRDLLADNLVCKSTSEQKTECWVTTSKRPAGSRYGSRGSVTIDTPLPGESKPTAIYIRFLRGVYSFDHNGKAQLAGFGEQHLVGSNCLAAPRIISDIIRAADLPQGFVDVVECQWGESYGEVGIALKYNSADNHPAKGTGSCTTALLKGPWRAETAALAKTGHAVSFAAAPNMPKHDEGQVAQRGVFSTYPAHKDMLSLLPTPLFSAARAFYVGNDQCLIPVVSQRDSGSSRSAILLDMKTSTLRFVTDNAYRWTGKEYSLQPGAADNRLVAGLEGRWLRGAAPAQAKTCTPADFNGRWDRSDGARITIRGAGSDGVGGYASMDENPGDWVQGQHKYVSMRMKSACVYTAKCYASQRTSTNGVRDFKMVETACELVIDPATKRMTERGTSNSYSYTKAGMGAAKRKPPSAATPPEPAQPSQAVQALNSEQAAAAKREIQAYEARKKAIADQQAAKEAAYRKALADREALIAENNRRAAEARAKWEASAAACRAGDQSQCAPQPQR